VHKHEQNNTQSAARSENASEARLGVFSPQLQNVVFSMFRDSTQVSGPGRLPGWNFERNCCSFGIKSWCNLCAIYELLRSADSAILFKQSEGVGILG